MVESTEMTVEEKKSRFEETLGIIFHKDSKNIVCCDGAVFVIVPPENKSELRFYMDYGVGYTGKVYEGVLKSKYSTPFLLYKNTIYHHRQSELKLLFLMEGSTTYFNYALRYVEDLTWVVGCVGVSNLDQRVKDSLRSLIQDGVFNKFYSFSRIMYDIDVRLLYDFMLQYYGMGHIIDMLPNDIEDIFLPENSRAKAEDFDKFHNLKNIRGTDNISGRHILLSRGVRLNDRTY